MTPGGQRAPDTSSRATVPADVGAGKDFATLMIDPATRPPVVTAQYIHRLPVRSETATMAPYSSIHDLVNHGGGVLRGASNYNIYVNCPSSCWAVPSGFEINLGLSAMIHIVDQYNAAGTYGFGGSGQVSYKPTIHNLVDSDMQTIVTSYIKAHGTPIGYAAMYHVFLPQGTNECDAGDPEGGRPMIVSCYPADFCAYHSAARVIGLGHILYSDEPYQNVTGCKLQGPPPNGILADSTDSTLSNEIFETITDPDGTAWYDAAGNEIGDYCRPTEMNVTLSSRTYRIQGEYSNRISACAW